MTAQFVSRRRVGLCLWVLAPALALLPLLPSAVAADADFLRGDVNSDGQVSLADASLYGCILFCDPFPGSCEDAADVDDDGTIQVVDLAVLLESLFIGPGTSPAIPSPFPERGPDPTADDLGCGSYEVERPDEVDATFRAADSVGAPGEEVAIPIHVSTSQAAVGFQLLLRYDPALFEPLLVPDGEFLSRYFEGTVLEEALLDPDRLSHVFLGIRDRPEGGTLELGFLYHLLAIEEIPPGEDVHVVNLLGRVAEGSEVGHAMDLAFFERTAAHLAARSELAFADGRAGPVKRTLSGSLRVERGFVRGDSNSDGAVDISDAVAILLSLFVGAGDLACMDAADASDDGAVDLSDAIALLHFLFLGSAAPPRPHDACGADPTPDELDCGTYAPCP